MTETNLYSTPEAVVDDRSSDMYQPKIFSASGRIGRLRYLAYFMAVYLLTMVVIIPVMGGIGFMQASSGANPENMGAFSIILMAAIYIFMTVMAFIFAKRRLNDLDKSGWFILLSFIPIINIVMAIYMIFFPGTDGPNRFGPPPTPNPLGVKILGLALPGIAIIGVLAAIAIPAYHDYSQRAQQAVEQQP